MSGSDFFVEFRSVIRVRCVYTVNFTSLRTAVKSCVRAWSEREGVSATQRHGNSTYSLEESFPWVCVVHTLAPRSHAQFHGRSK